MFRLAAVGLASGGWGRGGGWRTVHCGFPGHDSEVTGAVAMTAHLAKPAAGGGPAGAGGAGGAGGVGGVGGGLRIPSKPPRMPRRSGPSAAGLAAVNVVAESRESRTGRNFIIAMECRMVVRE